MTRGEARAELTALIADAKASSEKIVKRAEALIAALHDGATGAPPAPSDAPSLPARADATRSRLSESPFVGVRIEARYGGACHVCGAAYSAGDFVLFARELKRCACAGCGVAKPREAGRP